MRSTLFLVLAITSSCAPRLLDDHPFDGEVSSGPLVSTQVLDGAVTLMTVDATSKGSQVYVDFDEGREMKAAEAFSTNGWDLAFKRFEVTLNGGAGNPMGSVWAAVLKGQDFDALTQAPASGFQQDGSTSVFSGVEGGWYVYDLGVHRVLARPDLLYVIKSSAGVYFKLQLLNYYDAAGTPAAISLKYAAVAAP